MNNSIRPFSNKSNEDVKGIIENVASKLSMNKGSNSWLSICILSAYMHNCNSKDESINSVHGNIAYFNALAARGDHDYLLVVRSSASGEEIALEVHRVSPVGID
jgi:hypothetical protein